MVSNLGQRAADYADFQSGFRRARSERYNLQQQQMQVEEMRRRAEAAQRQAELEAQRGGARAGMLTPPPSFDPTTGRPMPVDTTPTAGLRADGTPSATTAPADITRAGIQGAPLEDADDPPMTEAAQLRLDLQEAYRLLDVRRQNGFDVTGTEERIAILEQRLEEAVQRERVVGEGSAPPDERGIGEREEREPERMPSVEVPEDIMREAQAYDNARTPYNSLMEQAATQNGIDPVIFKRLIGTESSFRPDAVSSLGADAGFGIAQISADHGLSEAERQTPAVAIPAGAEIFARMLEQQGGDYLEAIMQYKGASSEQGRANMMRPAQIILAGTEHYPGAGTESARTQTASVSPQVRQEAEQESEALTSETREQAGLTAQDDVISDPASDRGVSTYSAGAEAPQRVGIDTQRLLRTREGLVRLAQINAEAGTAEGNERFDALYTQIQEIDSRLQFLQGMQGVNEFRMQNNPSRLASVWSAYAGMNIQIQNRTDGAYNIYIEGELAQEGVSQEQIVSSAKQAFSQEYREALAARQAQEIELRDDIRLEAAKRQLEAQYKGADVLDVVPGGTNESDIIIFRNQDGSLGAMQYDPGQEGIAPGMFRSGRPEVPGSLGSVPIQTPLGATGGGANFNPDVIANWNN